VTAASTTTSERKARDVAARVAARYDRERDRYEKLTTRVADICRHDIVEANAIRATVAGRTKDGSRLETKIARKIVDDAWPADMTVDQVFDRVGDLAAVRISTYLEADRLRVVDLVRETFGGPDGGHVVVDDKDKYDAHAGTFYRATHCDVVLPDEELAGGYGNLRGVRCEIQVCSMLAHVWNEIEHDLVYKPLSGPISPEERDALKSLGHMLIAADLVLEELYRATQRRQEQEGGAYTDVYDFVARTRGAFPDAVRFGDHAGQLFDELAAAGLSSPEGLRDLLNEDAADESRRRIEAYRARTADDERAPVLDPATSDRLLVLVLDQQADAIAKRHPTGRGLGRPPRIASIARRFTDKE
jgi:ppGpp synthetase/RelA/SpoT-type nucleotidyltranferase